VDVEHLDAQARRFHRCFGHRGGDIMKLEIEKNLPANFLNEPHGLRAGARKELLSDFEHSDFWRQEWNQLLNVVEMVDIESDNQPLSHR
jgi:hypothetical protein